MNKPISMIDVIRAGAGQSVAIPTDVEYLGAREARAQRMVYAALVNFKSAIQDAAALSDYFRDHAPYVLNALADNIPSKTAWDEETAKRCET